MNTLQLNISKEILDRLQGFINEKVHQMRSSDGNGFSEFGGTFIGTFDGEIVSITDFIYDEKGKGTRSLIRFSHHVISETRNKVALKNKSILNYNDKSYYIGTWHVHPPGCSSDYSSVDYSTLFQEKMWLQAGSVEVEHPKIHAIFESNSENYSFYTMNYESQFEIEEIDGVEFENLSDHILNRKENYSFLINSNEEDKTIVDYDFYANNGQAIFGFGRYSKHLKVYNDFHKIFLTNFFLKDKSNESFIYTVAYKGSNICLFFKVTPTKINHDAILDNISFVKIEPKFFENQKKLQVIDAYDLERNMVFEPSDRLLSDISREVIQAFNLSLPPSFYIILNSSYLDILENEIPDYLTTDLAKILQKIKRKELIFEQSNYKLHLPDDISLNTIEALSDESNTIYLESLELKPELIYNNRVQRMELSGYNTAELKDKMVFVGGMGMLGNEITNNLAIAGVGHFTIIDNGNVDWYNIYRQPLFNKHNVYQKKVEASKSELEAMEGVQVTPLNFEVPCLATKRDKKMVFKRLTLLNEAIKESDIVIGAFDIKSARFVLQILAIYNNKTFISSALDTSIGEVSLHRKDIDACYCCGSRLSTFDGGVCTLSKISTQKIIGGLTSELILNILMDKSIKMREQEYNCIRFNENVLNMNTRKRVPSKSCTICQGDHFSDENSVFEFIYDLLFNSENL